MSFKNLSQWAKSLRDISQDFPVLVEGKRDREALNRLGVKNVITLAGKRLADIPDLLESHYGGAVLLYDLDAKGEDINEKVKELLLSQGFLVIEEFREYLREVGIIHIEELKGKSHG